MHAYNMLTRIYDYMYYFVKILFDIVIASIAVLTLLCVLI